MDHDTALTLAQAELGRALGIAPEATVLVSGEPVDWPDGSLGCPEKGMAYVQAITPGWRFGLQAAGREHRVHVGGRRAVVCRQIP